MVKISIMELEKKTIREENYREKFSHYQIMEVPTQIGLKKDLNSCWTVKAPRNFEQYKEKLLGPNAQKSCFVASIPKKSQFFRKSLKSQIWILDMATKLPRTLFLP